MVTPHVQVQHAGAPALPRSVLEKTFAALKYRNYRLWFMGQLASLIGTWMQTTAQGFLVFQLTHSPAYLGYVGFAAGIPTWLLMLFAGVLADRVPRRNLLVVTQTTMMILAFILAALTFAGLVQPWHIVLLAFLLGIANAFDAPARQAFVLEMVGREDLANGIALNSTMFQSATVVGPAVAGLTYAWFGPAWCFTINGISFLAVIVALVMMNLEPLPPRTRMTSALHDLKEGLTFVVSNSVIRNLIGIVGIASLFGMAFVTLLPAWAVTVLGGDATTNGLLQSARGLGALLGALMIASFGRFRFKGRLLTLGSFVFPISLIIFSGISSLPMSLLALIVVGWGFMVLFNMANTLVQTQVTDELRGRVMAVYSLTFFGLMPLGALWSGAVAAVVGPPLTVVVGAAISLAFAVLVFVFAPRVWAL
jgi:MFS family permease